MIRTLARWVKRQTMYTGLAETAPLRNYLQERQHPGWPYVPPDEGDILYRLAREHAGGRALEVGMATGSTAGHLLLGIAPGQVTSIDYDQNNHAREGERLVRELGYSDRHRLLEDNSVDVLPRLWAAGERFQLIFLDGWKTFDHMWVDVFYCAKMLATGGHMMFDDARMPAVRKCISLLRTHYSFEPVETYPLVGGGRQRLWHLLTSRATLPPYVVLRKPQEIGDTPAGRNFEFWTPF